MIFHGPEEWFHIIWYYVLYLWGKLRIMLLYGDLMEIRWNIRGFQWYSIVFQWPLDGSRILIIEWFYMAFWRAIYNIIQYIYVHLRPQKRIKKMERGQFTSILVGFCLTVFFWWLPCNAIPWVATEVSYGVRPSLVPVAPWWTSWKTCCGVVDHFFGMKKA